MATIGSYRFRQIERGISNKTFPEEELHHESNIDGGRGW